MGRPFTEQEGLQAFGRVRPLATGLAASSEGLSGKPYKLPLGNFPPQFDLQFDLQLQRR